MAQMLRLAKRIFFARESVISNLFPRNKSIILSESAFRSACAQSRSRAEMVSFDARGQFG
jgi:hypothetical protein